MTGKITESPFSEQALNDLRDGWANLLPDPADAKIVDEGQPFLLRALSQWLKKFNDPDAHWLVFLCGLTRLRTDLSLLHFRTPKEGYSVCTSVIRSPSTTMCEDLARATEAQDGKKPDAHWLVDESDSFANGVCIGVDKPLPRSPQVFPLKTKHRKLDETEFAAIADNYPSAQLSSEELEKKFREEEQLGRMQAVGERPFGKVP